MENIKNYIYDKFERLMEYLGIDPFLTWTFIALVLFLIVWGKELPLISKKSATGYEKVLKHYLISVVVLLFVLLISLTIYIIDMLLK